MFYIVHKLCARKYRKEQYVNLSDDIKFNWVYENAFLDSTRVYTDVVKNESDFNIKGGNLSFQPSHVQKANQKIWLLRRVAHLQTIE